MKKRVNVLTHVDNCTVTRMMGDLADQMMKYQMYSWPPETRGQGCLSGDMNVMVSMINLRNRLSLIIEKSRKANE